MGQAQSDSNEAKSQVDKAINEVNAIMEELAGLRDINVDDLDALGKITTMDLVNFQYYIEMFFRVL